MPVFSAIGRILLMKANGSPNSSQLGSKTGHSGGGLNSSVRGRDIVMDRSGRPQMSKTCSKVYARSYYSERLPPVFTFPPSVSLGRHQHEKLLTHIHAQQAECSKAVSTSAQKNRYQIIQRFFIPFLTKQLLAQPVWQTQVGLSRYLSLVKLKQ